MHFEHIYMHSKLHLVTPPRSSPVPYPSPNFTSLLIQSTHKLQLVFFEVWSHPLWSGQPTRSDTLKDALIVPCLGRGWSPPQPVLWYWLDTDWLELPETTTTVPSHTRRGCYFADSPSSYSLNEEYLLEREPQQWDCFTGSNNTRHCHVTLCFWATTRLSAFPL